MTIHSLKETEEKMQKAVAFFKQKLSGLRTGRASASLVDNIRVEVYGSPAPLSNVATISVPEARMISLQVWDKANIKAVEKAIIDSQIGINPVVDGTLIRLPMPELSGERRKELVKIASKFLEESRIAIRNIRRDSIDFFKKQEKEDEITEDDLRRGSDQVQKLTDKYIAELEKLFHDKEKDILSF
ncbi:MAG: ribosome recycling factor [Alphaproteobacteria bacterium]|jgi:ribosome recycling factor